jgi:hypothetical protein
MGGGKLTFTGCAAAGAHPRAQLRAAQELQLLQLGYRGNCCACGFKTHTVGPTDKSRITTEALEFGFYKMHAPSRTENHFFFF